MRSKRDRSGATRRPPSLRVVALRPDSAEREGLNRSHGRPHAPGSFHWSPMHGSPRSGPKSGGRAVGSSSYYLMPWQRASACRCVDKF